MNSKHTKHALWLLLVPTLAQAHQSRSYSGLTLDGTALVHEDERVADEDDGDRSCPMAVAKVVDLATQQETTYVRGWTCTDKKDALPAGRGKSWKEFLAFEKAHPLSTLNGTKGPKGAQVVELQSHCAALHCSAKACEIKLETKGKACSGEDERVVGTLTVGIKKADGRVYPAMEFEVGNIAGGQEETLFLSWLPDESSVGLLRFRDTAAGRYADTEWTVAELRLAPTRVRVLGYVKEGDGEKLAAKVAAPLRSLGHSVSFGTTKDARTDSVVYAAPGFEAAAAKIAAAVPGARVDKLSWKADADIVVAVAGK